MTSVINDSNSIARIEEMERLSRKWARGLSAAELDRQIQANRVTAMSLLHRMEALDMLARAALAIREMRKCGDA